jgi:hypothetical protein
MDCRAAPCPFRKLNPADSRAPTESEHDCWMLRIAFLLGRVLCDCFKSRRRLEVEILVLRHQLNLLRQRAPRRLYALVRHRLPPPPQPHLGHAAGGAGSRGAPRARNGHTTALFATRCQSFLDNVIASLAQVGAWNDLPATSTPLTIPGPDMARWR